MRRVPLMGVAIGILAVVGSLSSASGASAATATATTPVSPVDAAGTVWLCRPGLADNPCGGSLSATTVSASGRRTVHADRVPKRLRDDCFYLYPTASTEPTVNSDLTVQSSEIENATAQAARFSKVCNVWAPMYRQVTVSGLALANSTDPGAYTVAYDSVLADWDDFIAHDDDGAPIIFIGHSQGSVMLIKLLQAEVDPNPTLRHQMVAAIIAGGNVTVPDGRTEGATFQNIPICTSDGQRGCVIAYSSFPSAPPPDANFGIPGQGISLTTGQTATTGVHVACVNPADIGGGTADLDTYWPLTPAPPVPSMQPPGPAVTTPWLYYPRQYSATCESAGDATWLQVTKVPRTSDVRPFVGEIAGPTWGYHFQDINLSLGNLVADVHSAEATATP
jgi:hypothetical protein